MSSPPTTIAVRDATVGPESGTIAVSCGAISTASMSRLELGGHDLGEDRLRALAHLGRRREDPDPTLGGQLEAHDRAHLRLAGAGEAGPVPGQGEADPAGRPVARRASRPGLGRSCPDPLELGRLGGALEDLLAGDAAAQDLVGRGDATQPVDVPAPDLERRQPDRLGDPVELGLRRELGLGRPEAAERSVRRRVRATARARIRTLGTSYGPPAWIVARDRTTGVSVRTLRRP